MIKACDKASKFIIRDFGEIENLQVSKKGPRDFVTKTDKKVEEILVSELTKSKKGYSFITEESGKIFNKNKNIFVFGLSVFRFYLNCIFDKQISIWIAKSAYICTLSSIFMVLTPIL